MAEISVSEYRKMNLPDKNESKTVEHVHRNAETLKIKLVKGQKDSYGWEISCAGATLPEILLQVRAADAALKAEWGI